MILSVVITLMLSLIAWYIIFGLECFMNGATYENSLTMPFVELARDFYYNLPGGWNRRLTACRGNAERARQFSGWWHIFFMHFILPFGPTLVVLSIWL